MDSSTPTSSHHLRTLQPRSTSAATAVHSAAEPERGEQDLDELVSPNPTAQHLPPVDHGRAAYLFLLASFLIECILWGFPFSFGVLQEYYATHPPIAVNIRNLSAVGTTCSVSFLSPPCSTRRFQCCTLPRQRRARTNMSF